MVRSKEIWLILIAAVAVVIGGVFFVSYRVTEESRQASVEKLKAKTVQKPANAILNPDTSKEAVEHTDTSGQQAGETDLPTISDEESIAAYARLSEKRSSVMEDPSWKEVIEILDEKGHEPGQWTDDEKAKIATYLAANRDIILELRRLADLGGPAWNKDQPLRQKVETTLPQLAKMRDYARLLANDAMVYANAGNYEEAVKSILAGMKLANTLDDTLLFSQLVRVAMNGVMYNAIETSIRGEDLSPELCSELLQYAASFNGRQSFSNSCGGEGNYGLMAFEGFRNGDLSAFGMEEAGSDVWAGRFLLRAYGSVIARPWLNMDESTYADIMAQYTEAAQLPYYQAKPLIDRISEEIQNLPGTRLLSRLFLPNIDHACEAQAVNEVRLDLMRLGLAVEQHHAQTGHYPDTLEQVAPILGGDLPIDPFTGQPYIYEPGQETFTLYCPMGTVIDLTNWRPAGSDEQGNIVWRSH